jgi:hypothetical protein
MQYEIEVPRKDLPAVTAAPEAPAMAYPCNCRVGGRDSLADAVIHGWKAHLRLVYGARKVPDGIYAGGEQILERSNPGVEPAVYLPVEKYRSVVPAKKAKGKPGRKPKAVKSPAAVLDVARLTAVPDVGDPGNNQPSGNGVRRAGGREGSGRDADQTPLPASPTKKWPCRWPECDGGSDESAVGRDQHERARHGSLAGPSTKGGWQSRISHIALPDKDADGRYPCSRDCGEVFDTKDDFLRHMAEGHPVPSALVQASPRRRP